MMSINVNGLVRGGREAREVTTFCSLLTAERGSMRTRRANDGLI